MKLSFTKMQGCANDYLYLDCRASGVPEKIVPLAAWPSGCMCTTRPVRKSPC